MHTMVPEKFFVDFQPVEGVDHYHFPGKEAGIMG